MRLPFFNLQRDFRPDVIRLMLPVVTEQTFITAMGVINTIFSSQISKEAAAAIGLIDSLNNIFITFFSALAIGSTVVVAHYQGQANQKKINIAARQSFYASLALAILISTAMALTRKPLIMVLFGSAEPLVLQNAHIYFLITLFTYPLIAVTSVICGVLRGGGDTRTPARVIIIMNGLNVILSYLLIYGLHWNFFGFNWYFSGWGIEGAALGIAIARTFGALLLTVILFKNFNPGKVKHRFNQRPDLSILKSIFQIGLPASIESLLFSAGKLFTQTFIVGMGTVAIVANYIGFSIQGLMTIPGNALGITATTMVGQCMGKGDTAEARKLLHSILRLSTFLLMVLNLLICLPLAAPIVELYNKDPEIIRLAAFILRLTVFFYLVWTYSFILPAGLKGAGDVKYTLVVSFLSMWVIRIGLGYLLGVTLKMGLTGIWLGMFGDWIIRGFWFYRRFQGERWQNHTVIKS